MKTRAEVLREKKLKAEGKPSAVERTLPLPVPDGVVKCGECGDESVASTCSTRADGFLECPNCGAPTALQKPTPTRVDASAEKPAPSPGPKDPHRKFCGECGAEWPIVEKAGVGQFWINCGHTHAERIEDPRKAKKYAPPAGLHGRSDAEVERRNAEDAKKGEDFGKVMNDANAHGSGAKKEPGFTPPSSPAEPRPAAFGPGPATLSGNRLSIPWGEARMPIDQWNNFKCGGHIITVEVPDGADRLEVARKILDDLEAIADLLFRRQKAWYEKKLGLLAGDSK